LAVATPNVVLYVTGWCPYCTRAKALLDRKGVSYTAIDVESRSGLRDEMMAKSGGRRSVPQIFIGDHHVGGCDDLHALEAAGSLDSLLGRTG
jgi:glutaredoxin 3